MGYRLGIDVGGTFTDLVLYDDVSSALSIEKVPSVPADPADGIVQGIVRLLRAAGVAPAAVGYVAHGTTAATNALLERKGARTALITTKGVSRSPGDRAAEAARPSTTSTRGSRSRWSPAIAATRWPNGS